MVLIKLGPARTEQEVQGRFHAQDEARNLELCALDSETLNSDPL